MFLHIEGYYFEFFIFFRFIKDKVSNIIYQNGIYVYLCPVIINNGT